MKGRKLLMIPGPIEFTPEVLSAMAKPTTSHVSPEFLECFGDSLDMMLDVFMADEYEPFVLPGSGTLAMDAAAVNLLEPGDRVLVVNSGYFGDRMNDILQTYGVKSDNLDSDVGDISSPEQVKNALQKQDYKALAVTQVDTSTGVLADIQGICQVAKDAGCLTIVDGVCGTAGAECRSREWGVDVYLTASQKAIGTPPGLALLTVSPEAMDVFYNRQTPVSNYYADFDNWLPIMHAYRKREASYFGTPPVNLLYALHVSLEQILAEGMDSRFARHRKLARAFRAGTKAIGLEGVPVSDDLAAPTLSALYYPEGVDSKLVSAISDEGVMVAGGLHGEIKDRYFRVGHMGAHNKSDIIATVGAIERALEQVGHDFDFGEGAAAAENLL